MIRQPHLMVVVEVLLVGCAGVLVVGFARGALGSPVGETGTPRSLRGERMHKVWTSGEYARIGNPLVLIGELLCEAADLRSADKILDLAAGSGSTAISAARRFCEVTGMDLAPESIEHTRRNTHAGTRTQEHARRRAEAEGMEITFEVGDAEDLSYPDASFDVVLSSIAVMFCPNQEPAAVELLRLCRPGGKIGLASWIRTATPATC